MIGNPNQFGFHAPNDPRVQIGPQGNYLNFTSSQICFNPSLPPPQQVGPNQYVIQPYHLIPQVRTVAQMHLNAQFPGQVQQPPVLPQLQQAIVAPVNPYVLYQRHLHQARMFQAIQQQMIALANVNHPYQRHIHQRQIAPMYYNQEPRNMMQPNYPMGGQFAVPQNAVAPMALPQFYMAPVNNFVPEPINPPPLPYRRHQ